MHIDDPELDHAAPPETVQVYRRQLERKLGRVALSTWNYLRTRRNRAGIATAKTATIAAALKRHPSHVRKGLQRLRESGIVAPAGGASPRDSMQVFGRCCDSIFAQVPYSVAVWVKQTRAWGGDRRGSGRPIVNVVDPLDAIFAQVPCRIVPSETAPARLKSGQLENVKSSCAGRQLDYSADKATAQLEYPSPRNGSANRSIKDQGSHIIKESVLCNTPSGYMQEHSTAGAAPPIFPIVSKEPQRRKPRETQPVAANIAHSMEGLAALMLTPPLGVRVQRWELLADLCDAGIVPSIPTWEECRPCVKPGAPLLPEELAHPPRGKMTEARNAMAERLRRVYRNVCKAKTKNQRAAYFPRSHASQRWLGEAGRLMGLHEIAPIAWIAWSFDQFNEAIRERAILKGRTHEAEPPPPSWVFSSKRLQIKRGWFRQCIGDTFAGGQTHETPLRRALVDRYWRMIRDMRADPDMSEQKARAAVGRAFPGGYDAALAAANEEVVRIRGELRKSVEDGVFVW